MSLHAQDKNINFWKKLAVLYHQGFLHVNDRIFFPLKSSMHIISNIFKWPLNFVYKIENTFIHCFYPNISLVILSYTEKLIAVIADVCAMLLSVFNISSKTLCVHTAYVLLILIYGNIWSLKKNSISQKAIVYVWHLYISKGISNFIQNYYCTEESCIVYSIILDDFRFRKIYGLKYETHFIQTYLGNFNDPESLPLKKLWHGLFPTQSRKKELQCGVCNPKSSWDNLKLGHLVCCRTQKFCRLFFNKT